MNKEERVAQAVAYFKEGYNCAQSVVLAYADLYGLTHDLALHVAASFGGGIGRMRETCGAACGMFCWLALSVALHREPTVKVKPPTMRWYSSWQKLSSKSTAP